MPKAYKGGDFERLISKSLSLWWTGGERDDVFWRSSQSGGRATQRSKAGVTTYGSYGDIAAVDPIGVPLIETFTIELKRGSSYGSPADLFDSLPTKAVRPFELCLVQAQKSHYEARSHAWMLIAQRDRRRSMIYLPNRAWIRELLCLRDAFPCVHFNMRFTTPHGPYFFRFFGLPLDHFLETVTPKQIIEYHAEQTRD